METDTFIILKFVALHEANKSATSECLALHVMTVLISLP